MSEPSVPFDFGAWLDARRSRVERAIERQLELLSTGDLVAQAERCERESIQATADQQWLLLHHAGRYRAAAALRGSDE